MTMIEQVARQLWRCGKDNKSFLRHDNEDDGWRDYAHDARKVIEAMREPTDAMKRRAESKSASFVVGDPYDQWQHMIAAALDDLPEGFSW